MNIEQITNRLNQMLNGKNLTREEAKALHMEIELRSLNWVVNKPGQYIVPGKPITHAIIDALVTAGFPEKYKDHISGIVIDSKGEANIQFYLLGEANEVLAFKEGYYFGQPITAKMTLQLGVY